MKLTRRKLAALVTVGVAAAPAQVPQPGAADEDLLKTKRDQMRANADAVAKREIPMATEPAFQFKA